MRFRLPLLNLLCLTVLALTLPACHCKSEMPQKIALLSADQKAFLSLPRAERIARFADQQERHHLMRLGYYPETYQITLPERAKDQPFSCILKEAAPIPGNAVTANVPEAPKKLHFRKDNAAVTIPPYVLAECQNGKLEFGNLKIHTVYEMTCKSPAGENRIRFMTEGFAPRLVKIAGIPNVRDLGGRKGLSGKYVRQGLIYRSAGLNGNASLKVASPREAKKAFGAKYDEAEKKFFANLAAWESKNPESKFFDLKNDPRWTLFFVPVSTPDEKITELKQIPEKFCGASGRKICMDQKNCYTIPKKAGGKAEVGKAVFLKEITVPADTFMVCSCGADWYWKLFCNGKLAANYENGNNKDFNAENYAFILPLKKGRNLIAATVFSGSYSWSWCFLADRAKALNAYKNAMREHFLGQFKIGKPGAIRLNAAAKKYIIKDLGIRSDVDLRSDRECDQMTGSPAGKEVTWFHYPSSAYAAMALPGSKAQFVKTFKVFLDARNYPVVFHCIAGADRTGAVAFILNGLLGVEEEELYRDWEATGFCTATVNFCHGKRFSKLVAVFEKYPGKNLNEKIENYVISCGFTKKDIETFRSFLLE